MNKSIQDAINSIKKFEQGLTAPVPTVRYLNEAAERSHRIFDNLINQIREFEQSLNDEQEVGYILADFNKDKIIYAQSISYEPPDLLIFKGISDGNAVRLAQHIAQLNILMVSAQKRVPDKPPTRIGFI